MTVKRKYTNWRKLTGLTTEQVRDAWKKYCAIYGPEQSDTGISSPDDMPRYPHQSERFRSCFEPQFHSLPVSDLVGYLIARRKKGKEIYMPGEG